jgi:hypothetical protein
LDGEYLVNFQIKQFSSIIHGSRKLRWNGVVSEEGPEKAILNV